MSRIFAPLGRVLIWLFGVDGGNSCLGEADVVAFYDPIQPLPIDAEKS